MKSLETSTKFLRELMPDNEKAVQSILETVFMPDFESFVPQRGKDKSAAEALQRARKALQNFINEASEFPADSLERIEKDTDVPLSSIAKLESAIKEEWALQTGWLKGTRPQGPQDIVAYFIAARVLQSMIDVKLPITFGTPENSNRPNTVYGKIVEEALDHHGRNCDWRRVAEAIFQEYRASQQAELQ